MKTLKLCKMFGMTDLQPHVDAFIKSNEKLIYYKNATLKSDIETNMYIKVIEELADKL